MIYCKTETTDQMRESVMQVAMFLILLLLRTIIGVVVLLMANLAIHFAPMLWHLLPGQSSNRSSRPESNSDRWFDTHTYHRWTGVWVFFVLMMAMCASVDYVTGVLPGFAGLPVIARAIGCSAVLLVITLVLTILGKSNEELLEYPFGQSGFKSGPSFDGFNITLSEVFILSPLFVSEFLRDRLRIQR